MPDLTELLQEFERGPAQLEAMLRGLTPADFDAVPVAGKWSIRQVICHLADFEIVNTDRMKRILSEDNPTFFDADPDLFERALHYSARDLPEELQIIRSLRSHMARILRASEMESFQRTGVHSSAGPLTLEGLVERAVRHIPHHLPFLQEKVAVLKAVT